MHQHGASARCCSWMPLLNLQKWQGGHGRHPLDTSPSLCMYFNRHTCCTGNDGLLKGSAVWFSWVGAVWWRVAGHRDCGHLPCWSLLQRDASQKGASTAFSFQKSLRCFDSGAMAQAQQLQAFQPGPAPAIAAQNVAFTANGAADASRRSKRNRQLYGRRST
jgi:hypothetical protein